MYEAKKMLKWAYISSAVLRIGEDTFEVMGHKDIDGNINENTFWVNGVAAGTNDITEAVANEKEMLLPHTISGYPINFRWVSTKQREFSVSLDEFQWIVFKTWNSFVRVDMANAKPYDFKGSLGLMGSYGTGVKVARDRTTIINDPNEFGMEWQVLASEPHLFHNREGPQAPEKCTLPTATDARRRLGEQLISQDAAEKACSHVNKSDRDLCVFDVMATNNIDIAAAY